MANAVIRYLNRRNPSKCKRTFCQQDTERAPFVGAPSVKPKKL
jgi:hypothetical protein